MTDEIPTALEMAQQAAKALLDLSDDKTAEMRGRVSQESLVELEKILREGTQVFSLLSIAESLDRIAGAGIETYELDADGHRRYR